MRFYGLKILLIIISLYLASCGDSINLIAVIESEEQSSDLQTFSYTIKVEEIENECDATNVTVTIITLVSNFSDISPGSRITTTHSIGDVGKGGTKTSTFTINTDGKQVNIFGGASMGAVEGDPNCSFLGLGG